MVDALFVISPKSKQKGNSTKKSLLGFGMTTVFNKVQCKTVADPNAVTFFML